MKWDVNEAWTTGGLSYSPDISSVVREVTSMEDWQSGNAISILILDAGSIGSRALWAFDKEGYITYPNTQSEFRHYRIHRFMKFQAEYTSQNYGMCIERELGTGYDNADISAAPDNVNFGYISGTKYVAGFRFSNITLPLSATLSSVSMLLPTDGTYTSPLSLQLYAEDYAFPQPYSSVDVPLRRDRLPTYIPWSVTDTWYYTDWHTSPDLTTLMEAIQQIPGWTAGSPIAFDIVPTAEAAQQSSRRVWGFGRDPRTSIHDFVDAGPTLYQPYVSEPFVVM